MSAAFWQVTYARARHGIAKVPRPGDRNAREEEVMGIIMISCPATGRGISTGIEVWETDQLPIVTASTLCPACGLVHQWTKNQAWLASSGEQYRVADAVNGE
jgi:hypothetical protein